MIFVKIRKKKTSDNVRTPCRHMNMLNENRAMSVPERNIADFCGSLDLPLNHEPSLSPRRFPRKCLSFCPFENFFGKKSLT